MGKEKMKEAQEQVLLHAFTTPNATTIAAMEDARAGRVTQAANLDTLFNDLNANT